MAGYLDGFDDVIKGYDFLATLDHRTCLVCGVRDGERTFKPPHCKAGRIHPGCRCLYIPVTVISDMGDDTRPAENADFHWEAEKLYSQKYPNKDWSRLSGTTQDKYRREAMREYEKRRRKRAYSHVSARTTFVKYFSTWSSEEQEHYLGSERYRIFKWHHLELRDLVDLKNNREYTIDELKRKYEPEDGSKPKYDPDEPESDSPTYHNFFWKPDGRSTPTPAPKTITVICPFCGARYEDLPASYIGRKAECGVCHGKLIMSSDA